MKRIFLLIFLTVFVSITYSQHRIVGPDRFAKIIEDTTVQRLDLRSESEYHIFGHIPDFIQINCMSKRFKERVKATFDTTKTLAVYCMSGHRSPKAVHILLEMGFKTVYELDGGLLNWLANRRKLE